MLRKSVDERYLYRELRETSKTTTLLEWSIYNKGPGLRHQGLKETELVPTVGDLEDTKWNEKMNGEFEDCLLVAGKEQIHFGIQGVTHRSNGRAQT